MILESLDFLLHSFLAPKYVTKLGLIHEIIGIKYRQKRLSEAWQEHRDNSKKQILEQVTKLPQKRKALIIGAGLLLDVPAKELTESFEEVIFVDVFFLQEAINKMKLLSNCRFEQLDISSKLKEIYYLWINANKDKKEFENKARNLLYKKPNHFLLEADIDYVCSCNLLSQLQLPFENFIEKNKIEESETIKQLIDSFQINHIEYLKNFPKHTHIHLLTDTQKLVFNREHNLVGSGASVKEEIIRDFKKEAQWIWDLADFDELETNYALKLQSGSYSLKK